MEQYVPLLTVLLVLLGKGGARLADGSVCAVVLALLLAPFRLDRVTLINTVFVVVMVMGVVAMAAVAPVAPVASPGVRVALTFPGIAARCNLLLLSTHRLTKKMTAARKSRGKGNAVQG